MAQPLRQEALQSVNLEPVVRMSETQVTRLAKLCNGMLWDQFKIDIDPADNRVPVDENGNSRIQIFGRNKEGREGLYTPEELGITTNSNEFIREAEKGNVFVYPAGKSNPVQLQAFTNDPEDITKTSFAVSPEVEPNQLPLPEPKKMGFWRGAARVVTFGLAFRSRARRIRYQNQDYPKMREKLQKAKEQRGKNSQRELDNVQNLENRRKERAVQAEREKTFQKCVAETNAKKIGENNVVSMFGPQPKLQNEHIRVVENGKLKNRGIYTVDQFKDLTVFTKDAKQRQTAQEKEKNKLSASEKEKFKGYKFVEFDKDAIELGPNKAKLTDEEFASVALLTCWRPDITKREYEKSNDYDPTSEESLRMLGVPEEDVIPLLSYSCRAMGTADHYMVEGREHEGEKFEYFSDVGRQETVKAFQAYQQGDKTELAKLIANGVNQAPKCLKTSQAKYRVDYEINCSAFALKNLHSLMEKDPELQQLALKNGMKPENLEASKGMIKLSEMDDEDRLSMKKLAESAARNPQGLSKQEKKDYAAKIVANKLAVLELKQNISKIANEPKVKELTDKFKYVPSPERDGFNNGKKTEKKPMDEWKVLPKGQIWHGAQGPVSFGITSMYGSIPRSVLDLSKQQSYDNIMKMAEKIVENEKLADKSPEELFKDLGPTGNFSISSAREKIVNPEGAKPEHQKAQPVQQKQLQNDVQKNQDGKQQEFQGIGF